MDGGCDAWKSLLLYRCLIIYFMQLPEGPVFANFKQHMVAQNIKSIWNIFGAWLEIKGNITSNFQ